MDDKQKQIQERMAKLRAAKKSKSQTVQEKKLDEGKKVDLNSMTVDELKQYIASKSPEEKPRVTAPASVDSEIVHLYLHGNLPINQLGEKYGLDGAEVIAVLSRNGFNFKPSANIYDKNGQLPETGLDIY